MTTARAREVLRALQEASLLDHGAGGRYAMHDLLREFAGERAKVEMGTTERSRAERRLAAWYLHSADAADTMIAPQRRRVALHPIPRPPGTAAFGDRESAVAWCDQELVNLSSVVDRAAARDDHDIAWRFGATLWNYFYLRKDFVEWEHMNRVGLASAEALRDPVAKFTALNGLASARRHQKRFSDAVGHYRSALELVDQLDDPWNEAWLSNNLAESLRGLGAHDEALDWYDKAIEISEALGDTWSRGCFLTNLGEAYAQLGRYEDAIAAYRAALPLRREHDHVYGEGWTRNDLGEAYHGLGQTERALVEYERSLRLRREAGDRFGEAWTIHNVAAAMEDAGRVEEAAGLFTDALRLRRALGDGSGAAASADRLARILDRQGRRAPARELWRQCLAAFEEVDPDRAEAVRRLIERTDG